MFGFQEIVVAGISAFLTGVIAWVVSLRKAKTEETNIVLEAWKEIVTPLREQLVDTQKQLMETKNELAALQIKFEHELARRDERELQLLVRIRELESHDKNNTHKD